MLNIHPDFRTLMEHNAFLSTWCKTFLRARGREVFFLNTLEISLVQTPQEGPFQVMFVETQHTKEQKELNTRKRKSQDTTQITSASAGSRIKFSSKIMSFLVRTLCLCLVLTTIFISISPFSHSLVTMSSSAPSGVRRVNRWTQNAEQRAVRTFIMNLRHSPDTTSTSSLMKGI